MSSFQTQLEPKQSKNLRLTITFVIFVVSTILLAGCQKTGQLWSEPSELSENLVNIESTEQTEGDVKQNESLPEEPSEIEYTLTATISGQTASELLQQNFEVEFIDFDFGQFVQSINGLTGNDKNFWGFYLNDEFATQSVDNTRLETGDVIRFVYQAVEMPN